MYTQERYRCGQNRKDRVTLTVIGGGYRGRHRSCICGNTGVRACKCKIYLLGTSYSGCVYDMVYDEAGSSNNQEEMCSCNRCHMPCIMCRQYSCKGCRLAVQGLQRLEHSLGGDEGTGLYHTVSRRWQMEQRVRGNERIFPDGKMPVCVRG